MIEIIEYILLMMCMAMLAIQIAQESTLAFKIKQLLQFYNRKFIPLSIYAMWRRLLGKHMWYLFPLVFLIVFIFNIYEYVKILFNCPYCISYHLGWMSLYFFTGYSLLGSLLFAPMAIIFVKILKRL